MNEAETRAQLIDKALEKAEWKLRDPHQVGQEIPVDGFDPAEWQKLKKQLVRMMQDERGRYNALPAGISDYVLYRENGEVLAVVEARKTAVDVRLAEAQLTHYVTEIDKHQSFRPFGFMANGLEIYFVDVGIAHQHEAIRRVCEAFEIPSRRLDDNQENRPEGLDGPTQLLKKKPSGRSGGKRQALIVMATGTGKTRTTMGLIDVFMRSNQARRIPLL